MPGALHYVTRPRVLRRSGTIALVVGCLLSAINQADTIWAGAFSAVVACKIAGNFLVPFVVASVSAALNRPAEPPAVRFGP